MRGLSDDSLQDWAETEDLALDEGLSCIEVGIS